MRGSWKIGTVLLALAFVAMAFAGCGKKAGAKDAITPEKAAKAPPATAGGPAAANAAKSGVGK
jgi:hypothetical protein